MLRSLPRLFRAAKIQPAQIVGMAEKADPQDKGKTWKFVLLIFSGLGKAV